MGEGGAGSRGEDAGKGLKTKIATFSSWRERSPPLLTSLLAKEAFFV
jgi:hypothetical protein